jgi:hypothetical protein
MMGWMSILTFCYSSIAGDFFFKTIITYEYAGWMRRRRRTAALETTKWLEEGNGGLFIRACLLEGDKIIQNRNSMSRW